MVSSGQLPWCPEVPEISLIQYFCDFKAPRHQGTKGLVWQTIERAYVRQSIDVKRCDVLRLSQVMG